MVNNQIRDRPQKRVKIERRQRRAEEERPPQVEALPATDDFRSMLREVMAADPLPMVAQYLIVLPQ